MIWFRQLLFCLVSFGCLVGSNVAWAQAAAPAPAPAKPQALNSNIVLFEIRLGQTLLSDSLSAFQLRNKVYLPLGEMANLMTVGIRVNPAAGTARGSIRGDNNTFSLNVANTAVTLGEKNFTFDPKDVLLQDDDIFVESKLLADWLLVDFEISLTSLSVVLKPREPLPLQARLEREAKQAQLRTQSAPVELNYPKVDNPYKLIDVPFIDQTLLFGTQGTNGSRTSSAAYTTYIRGDLAGLQASLFLSGTSERNSQQHRFTVGRSDPQGELLGPLEARSFALGNISVPGVQNVSSGGDGNGFFISTVPLERATRFDSHTLRGDLPPGWDVELYLNNVLIAYQQARPDGKYAFENLRLVYGANEFRLVFHGPQGQLRVERSNFLLNDSLTEPGSFYYTLASNRDTIGLQRTVATGEWGISKTLTAALSTVNQQATDGKRANYTTVGLRGFAVGAIFVGNFTRQSNGGSLYEFSARSRIGELAVGWNHLQLQDFSSDAFPLSSDPLKTRDEFRVDGSLHTQSLGVFPFSAELRADRLKSGATALNASAIVSATVARATVSNLINVSSIQNVRSVNGALQVAGSLGDFRLGGQANYVIRPQAKLSSLALQAGRSLGPGYLLNVGANYAIQDRTLQLTSSLTRSFGSFALALSGGISNKGQFNVGVQIFTGIAREPRRSQWMFDAVPQADSGGLSARVFADTNGNGIMDADEQPIPNVGFLINASSHAARTDEAGIAYVGRLYGNRNSDIAVNPTTIDDPQLVSSLKGMRVITRPGVITQLDFPLVQTGEIDGTAFLVRNGRKRGAANVLLELVDKSGKVVTDMRSGADGFFVMTELLPGEYTLRMNELQIRELKLRDPGQRQVVMSPKGSFVNGQDFSLELLGAD